MRCVLALVVATVAAHGQDFPTDWLVLGPTGRSGRSTVHTDALEALRVVGTLPTPTAGAELRLPDGSAVSWRKVARQGHILNVPPGGYAFAVLDAPAAQPMLLVARGHAHVFVNGEPHAGNPYRTDWYELPVRLVAGRNEFLFRAARPPLELSLLPCPKEVFLSDKDRTLPDLLVDEAIDTWLGVRVVNASASVLRDHALRVSGPGLGEEPTPVPPLLPGCVQGCALRVRGSAPAAPGEITLQLALFHRGDGESEVRDTATLSLTVRGAGDRHRRTYRSEVDGSVQYYAVNPAIAAGKDHALVLSLHGASVEASGQAAAYSAKTWSYVVAPTNRRPYGFDWEDWGRIDAIDVLDDALRHYPVDPRRVYLTGHSMGGHGTWHVGVTFPSRFAAIGPSAGWIGFSSYGGGQHGDPANAIEGLLARAGASSDTLLLKQNLAQLGVYVLHGSADDNVPVREARRMRQELSAFHRDFDYHEQAGAGHWWDDGDEPGAGCVDWPPMFDFFARHRLPAATELRTIDFTTVNPGISARSHWACIEAQRVQLTPSRVQLRCDPGQRRITGSTENVARLLLDTTPFVGEGPLRVVLDGTTCEIAAPGPEVRVASGDDGWKEVPDDPAGKGPHRYGLFRTVFEHRFLLVPGTGGSAEERAWALAKARFDAETFWYRGNGSAELVPDHELTPERCRGRNVILYGNAITNRAFASLLDDAVRVEAGRIVVGDRPLVGDDLACLLVRPRRDEAATLVGVVGGSGIAGMRLTDRLPYFVSGVHYPDLFIVGPDMLAKGTGGVRVAGFFGLDWTVANGDIAWRP